MKKTITLVTLLLCGLQYSYGQKIAKNYLDSSEVAIHRAKLWFKAFDVGNVKTLQQLSVEGTETCDLQYLVDMHLKEDSMFHWGKSTWFEFKKDTVCGIIGISITASFDFRPGETKETAPSLQVFVHTNSKGKWIVNIYFSQFDLIECPCQMTEEERKLFHKQK